MKEHEHAGDLFLVPFPMFWNMGKIWDHFHETQTRLKVKKRVEGL